MTGGIKFKHYKSFSASFSERRELTDWSVVENTDPGSSLGRWKYHQQWPVDMYKLLMSRVLLACVFMRPFHF